MFSHLATLAEVRIMQDNFSENDYLSKYKAYYGIEFDSSFVIHHIDFDHSNNDIDNLILLPRKLHSHYHAIVSALQDFENPRTDGLVSLKITNQAIFFNRGKLFELSKVFTELENWEVLKHQSYKIPSIDIKLENGEVIECL